MIGYLSGKFLSSDDGNVIVDVGGVGYSVLVPGRTAAALLPGAALELFVHTNLRENALELFGFSTVWEKKVFLLLTSVSGVGPRTAMAILSGLEAETLLSAIVREDRATLGSVSGVGKKTVERLIVELSDKAHKLLSERPARVRGGTPIVSSQAALGAIAGAAKKRDKAKASGDIPPQGANAFDAPSGVDLTDLWNEAVGALANLGYREADALSVIRMASNRAIEEGQSVTLETLIKSSLLLLSRGMNR